MTSETAAKKDIQKLQRAIVEGLEDVKGQDIVVFNTADLSPLFERVIIASGTSNRQTKALASSVRDAVREAGFDKPRVEGEDNGEWIIVDCGQAVAHIMQPVIRQYYRLEEIWGTKPVRLKTGAEKAAEARQASQTTPARKTAAKAKSEAPAVPAKKVVRKTAAKAAATDVTPTRKKAAPSKSSVASKTAVKSAATPARTKATGATAKTKTSLPKVVVNAPKPAARKSPVKAASAKPAVKSPARKAAPKKKA